MECCVCGGIGFVPQDEKNETPQAFYAFTETVPPKNCGTSWHLQTVPQMKNCPACNPDAESTSTRKKVNLSDYPVKQPNYVPCKRCNRAGIEPNTQGTSTEKPCFSCKGTGVIPFKLL